MFTFYIDKQVQVTAREYHQISDEDAVNFEEKIKALLDTGADSQTIAEKFNSFTYGPQYLNDSAEEMSVEDNKGYPTIQVFAMDSTLIAQNGED